MLGVVGAELGRGQPAGLLPFREQLPAPRVHEQLPEVVAGRFGDRADIAEHHARGAIPGQVVPAAPDHHRGIGAEVLDEATQRGGDSLDRRLAGRRLLAAPQQDQVGALGRRQPQRLGDRLEHVHRGAHVAALLEPRVPGGAHTRQRSDLLAAQARRAAATAAREPHVLGLDARAAPAQEVGELGPAALAVAVLTIRRDSIRWRPGRFRALGCHVYYQDKPLSCTWIPIVAH